jgi:hypothetical protein
MSHCGLDRRAASLGSSRFEEENAMKKLTLIAIAALVTGLSVLATTALAGGGKGGGGGGIVKRGKCSAVSHWKLKAKADDGRIETEFEVDQNRVGKRWRVTLFRNGSVVFRGIRTTTAPSGTFEVRRLLAGSAEKLTATAKSLGSRETCRASLAI